MKKRSLLMITLLIAVVSLTVAVPASGSANEGCTPGYWKQKHHFDSWEPTGYSPDDMYCETFGIACPHGDVTLLQALKQGGGGAHALGRHAVAALLNAAHPDVNNYSVVWVTDAVECLYSSTCQPWVTFEAMKDEFESRNELGCPLN